jgi:hypothetical protein
LNWYLDRRARLMFNYVNAQVRDRLLPPAVAGGRATSGRRGCSFCSSGL